MRLLLPAAKRHVTTARLCRSVPKPIKYCTRATCARTPRPHRRRSCWRRRAVNYLRARPLPMLLRLSLHVIHYIACVHKPPCLAVTAKAHRPRGRRHLGGRLAKVAMRPYLCIYPRIAAAPANRAKTACLSGEIPATIRADSVPAKLHAGLAAYSWTSPVGCTHTQLAGRGAPAHKGNCRCDKPGEGLRFERRTFQVFHCSNKGVLTRTCTAFATNQSRSAAAHRGSS